MKKMIALLLAAAFILSCVPAMALDKKVTSDLLGTSVFLRRYGRYLYVLSHERFFQPANKQFAAL